jgi:alkyl hydroperoxide reductase subunit F
VLVVGGGPAGAAAAIYAARKGIRTGVVAERFGGQVLDTLAIENFISVKHTEGPQARAGAGGARQGIRGRRHEPAARRRADPCRATNLHEVKLANGATLKAKTVILATGARWREMNVPGEKEYRGKGVAFCPHCDGPLFKGKRVAVIGGGNSGVEAAIDLAGIVATSRCSNSTASCAPTPCCRPSWQPAQRHRHQERADHRGHRRRREGQRPRLQDRITARTAIELEGIFVQIGLLPNTDWLKGTLELSPRGEIEIDARGQTSLPGVFAAGDATTVPYKQIIIAMGEGAKAGCRPSTT